MKLIKTYLVLFNLLFLISYSQEKKDFEIINTISCDNIDAIFNFENIIFKEINLNLVNKKINNVDLIYFQYYNDVEISRGNFYTQNLVKSLKSNSDSIFNIKLYLKNIDNKQVKISTLFDEKHQSKIFEKLNNNPDNIDWNSFEIPKAKFYLKVYISFLSERDDILIDFFEFRIVDKISSNNKHIDEFDRNYIILYYAFN